MYDRLKSFRRAAACTGFVASLLVASSAMAQSKNCLDTLAGMPEMSRFVGVIAASHVGADLREVGPFTILAPTNAAIEAAPPFLVDRLFPKESDGRTADPVLAPAAVNAHILAGRYTSTAVSVGQSVQTRTRAGNLIEVSNQNGAVTIAAAGAGEAKVVKSDIACSNGVIHVIDHVLVR
ncbi:fasciclin domain-containing protein [Acetobacteraceae bacterium H6797]|nr:fasciclin domain-containing protein [Acetobacteraceae bacterium H6797]